MLKQMALAPGSTTIDQLRQQCTELLTEQSGPAGHKAMADLDTRVQPADAAQDKPSQVEPSALERRYGSELAIRKNPFGITAHRPNYLLIAAQNSTVNPEPFENEFDREIDLDHTEAKFQISLKFPLAVGLFNGRADLLAGYTNRSFWQLYNSDSAPFRETNHEPEIWLSFLNDAEIFGWRNAVNRIGFNHQSNGRGGDFLSRSWNRLYGHFLFEKGNQVLGIKPWWRIPESDDDDDNPDITDYLGYGEIAWSGTDGKNNVTVMLRNYLESGFSRGTTEFSWSFPIPGYSYLRGYLQVFNGYGESLIDYDSHNTSIGIGVNLSDWLE